MNSSTILTHSIALPLRSLRLTLVHPLLLDSPLPRARHPPSAITTIQQNPPHLQRTYKVLLGLAPEDATPQHLHIPSLHQLRRSNARHHTFTIAIRRHGRRFHGLGRWLLLDVRCYYR